jgi:hypothetical protein
MLKNTNTRIAISVLALLLSFSTAVQAQFSPGKLSDAHADLEGISNCTKCHDIGNKISEKKCLECHDEINDLIKADRGYHAYSEVQEQACIDCHSEHHGRAFDATRFDEEAFEHDWTGYELEGSHDRIECRDCHKSENIENKELSGREGTFLGLEEACLTCHVDYHQGTLAESCTDCHGFEKFEDAEFFDHGNTDFILEGQHKTVDCIECHRETIRNGESFQEFSGVAFSLCTDCHEDAHDGRFGVSCTDCHSTNGWNQLRAGNRFDHNLTNYPLEGQHTQVACAQCHTSGDYSESLAFDRCVDCHDDYHRDDFTSEDGVITDCDACHSLERDFTFSNYGLSDHQLSDYPLEGAHIATPCFACHKPQEEERWDFTIASESCVSCHDNVHEGYLESSDGSAVTCHECHNVDSWASISFDHSTTEFALEGAHEQANCRSCHFREEGPEQIFKGLGQSCTACHQTDSPHGDQFDSENGEAQCARCHNSDPGWSAKLFDHDSTQFPLEGRHREVSCDGCHRPEGTEEIIIYKIERFDCIDCHS